MNVIILGATALGTSVSLSTAIQCERCRRMTMVIVHNPLAPGAVCSPCAGRPS